MSRHISLRHLRCFLEIARCGSFTTAASRLYMTQSSLTNIIQQFEEGVGLKLFDRSTRRVTLTDEGARYVADAEQLIKRFDASIADLRSFSQLQRGHLRIAVAASVLDIFIVQVIELMRGKYPGITFSVRDAGARLVEKLVDEGEIDFAITSSFSGRDELVYQPLLRDSYGVVFRPDDALNNEEGEIEWSALDARRFVGFTGDTGIGAFLHANAPDFFERAGVHDEVSSTTSLFSLMKMPGQYSILTALSVSVDAARHLRFRPLAAPALAREVCLITRRLRSLSPAGEAFVSLLLQVLADSELPAGVTLAKGL
ncbi:LysR family transcriptional regulator [Xylophilus rhododendri]|uniref:LysR family transcriptional regulator n=1 Tax=Xylophilus rhododendri TaxID=2697032 RepID=A0A857J6W6_9BURK|nr:LysR family transcriptional regulator [Xylophilus rhododendri]QHI98555.1 LysR family transcriptional regulator [Xylophilus rhododendri]